jgi:RimJ/RimL family protein N-acetyltransferase
MTSEAEARHQLDRFFANALGCEPSLLQAPGMFLLPMSGGIAPFSLFRKCVLILHTPLAPAGTRPCVLAAHHLLLERLKPLLRGREGEQLVADEMVEHFTSLVRATFSAATLLHEGDPLVVRYVSAQTFQPYTGSALSFVAPLDGQHLEHLPLLSRYPGGVYAICDEQGQLLARAGIRAESPLVWEIGVRTEHEAQRGRGLAKAVVSAATEAVLAAGRVPLYIHSATNLASQKVALALGYQHYADERIWMLLE